MDDYSMIKKIPGGLISWKLPFDPMKVAKAAGDMQKMAFESQQ